MGITARLIEEVAQWCAIDDSLGEEREEALLDFPRGAAAGYWPGAGGANARHRRFLGWFMFTLREGQDRTPAERGADALCDGVERSQAALAFRGAQYVLAVTRSVLPGRSVFLEIEERRFEIPNRQWSRSFSPGCLIAAHLVPTERRGIWLPGPGWMELPLHAGPNMQRELGHLQADAVSLEKMLCGKLDTPAPVRHSSATLAEAVERMSRLARERGHPELILSEESWSSMVLRYMEEMDATGFYTTITASAAPADIDDAQLWTDHASDIWNNTPQPDRGGKSAAQLVEELRPERRKRPVRRRKSGSD